MKIFAFNKIKWLLAGLVVFALTLVFFVGNDLRGIDGKERAGQRMGKSVGVSVVQEVID